MNQNEAKLYINHTSVWIRAIAGGVEKACASVQHESENFSTSIQEQAEPVLFSSSQRNTEAWDVVDVLLFHRSTHADLTPRRLWQTWHIQRTDRPCCALFTISITNSKGLWVLVHHRKHLIRTTLLLYLLVFQPSSSSTVVTSYQECPGTDQKIPKPSCKAYYHSSRACERTNDVTATSTSTTHEHDQALGVLLCE